MKLVNDFTSKDTSRKKSDFQGLDMDVKTGITENFKISSYKNGASVQRSQEEQNHLHVDIVFGQWRETVREETESFNQLLRDSTPKI
jgi:hypothetical protein